MNPLLMFGLVGVALLVVISLCLRFRKVREIQKAIALWLARQFHILSLAAMIVAKAGKEGCIRCLSWPWQTKETGEPYSLFGIVGSRLVILATSLIILLGEVPINHYRSGALYHLTTSVLHLPFDLSLFTALLWMLVPGMYGLLLFEVLHLLPHEARIFPPLSQWVRIAVGTLAALCILACLVTVFFFQISGQCIVANLECASDESMQVYIVAGFGVLLNLAAIIATWGIVLGLAVVMGLLFGCIHVFCSAFQLLFSLVGDSLEGLGTPYQVPIPSPLHLLTTLPAQAESVPSSPIALLPSATTTTQTQEEIELMSTIQRTNTFLAYGSVGYREIPMSLETAKNNGMDATILCAAIVDLQRLYRNNEPLALSGGKDTSPSLTAIRDALADESVTPAYTKLAYHVNEQVVQAYTNKKHGGNIVLFVDASILPLVYEPIRKLKSRLPKQHVCLRISVPSRGHTQVLEADVASFVAMAKQDNIIAIVTDPYADFAVNHGEHTQEQITTLALLSLCCGPLIDERNPTFAEVSRELLTHSPFVGLSSCIVPVSVGQTTLLWNVVKWFAPSAGERGKGDLHDLIHQAKDATEKALTDPGCRASLGTIEKHVPAFVLYHIPLMPTDKRWQEFVTTMHAYIKRNYPEAQAIMVRANPPALPEMQHHYRCGVTVLYPVLFPTQPLSPQVTKHDQLDDLPIEETSEATPPLRNGQRRVRTAQS